MSGITINQNISSLLVQGRAAQNSARLNESFQKLSSGLRINRASDDAAGLSVASLLNADHKVLSQGIRNINDGISLLSIADGAATELSSIVARLKELATQAANGTLSVKQRNPIDQEADQLSEEFNRIIQSTEFNGRNLLLDPTSVYSISAGYGTAAAIGVDPAGGLSYNTGDGTFGARTSFGISGTTPADVEVADVNGDGALDIIAGSWNTNGVSVQLGNGNGTFKSGFNYGTTSSYNSSVAISDMNGDGALDIVTSDWFNGKIDVLLGNGNGTFKAVSSYNTGQVHLTEIQTADFNNDGISDVVSTNSFTGAGTLTVLLGNSNGSLKAQLTLGSGFAGIAGLDAGDINGDGNMDVVVADVTPGRVYTYLGNGNGTFKGAITTSTAANPYDAAMADFNEDRILDLFVTHSGSNSVGVMIGNGDGTFKSEALTDVGGIQYFGTTGDVNGDGLKDIVTGLYSAGKIAVMIGNGNGTFKAVTSYTTAGSVRNPVIGDMNGDGAVDIVEAEWSSNTVSMILGTPHAVTTIPKFDLTTRQSAQATLTQLDSFISTVSKGRGFIGAGLSRLESAASNLQQTTEGLKGAESRITDADVAEESATLVRTKILQQASYAILAQANSAPKIALTLLGAGGISK